MDWAKAIEINHAALTRIVLGLIAMVGLAADGTLARLPKPLYYAAWRVLRPAESAVRRLIVIAARGLVVKPVVHRPMPSGLNIARKGSRRVSFSLFDAPKRCVFPRLKRVKVEPRIRVIEFAQVFQPKDFQGPALEADGQADARHLGRRLAAAKMALDTLPRQAKRLARWRARQDKTHAPRYGSPLRRGLPPGWRGEPQDDVDRVLKDCDALARNALNQVSGVGYQAPKSGIPYLTPDT